MQTQFSFSSFPGWTEHFISLQSEQGVGSRERVVPEGRMGANITRSKCEWAHADVVKGRESDEVGLFTGATYRVGDGAVNSD